MLINDLYTIEQIVRQDNSKVLSVMIRINPSHDLFRGHFPGNPVLPGVCIIQIIKDILKDLSGNNLGIEKIISIKYLSFINPEVNSRIKLDIELNEPANGVIYCNSCLSFETTIFCRFKGSFKIL